MIQSAYKPVELKAPESVKAPVKSNESHKSSKLSASEKNEFKDKLKAASTSDEPKVKSVEVSSDKALRKPSSLINKHLEEGNPETVTPKVFDPALTQDVQDLINPETVKAEGVSPEEMLKMMLEGEAVALTGEPVSAEALQALMEAEMTPEMLEMNAELEKAQGRAPAIELAENADPQLMNMEDFVAQKNMANKKALPQQAYGMKNPAANKIALENDLKSTQVVKDLAALEGTTGQGTGSVNSQQFILNNLSEQGSAKVSDSSAAPKVFDMSQVKSADSGKIMNQISDYIMQAKAAKEPTVTMRVNHQELGMIDITVMKSQMMNADAVAINIGTHTADGKNFFQQNSKELFSHLSSAGINVSDLKVETPNNASKSDFDFSQSQKQASSQDKQFGSEQNQRRQEQEKRQDLWKMFNKEAA